MQTSSTGVAFGLRLLDVAPCLSISYIVHLRWPQWMMRDSTGNCYIVKACFYLLIDALNLRFSLFIDARVVICEEITCTRHAEEVVLSFAWAFLT